MEAKTNNARSWSLPFSHALIKELYVITFGCTCWCSMEAKTIKARCGFSPVITSGCTRSCTWSHLASHADAPWKQFFWFSSRDFIVYVFDCWFYIKMIQNDSSKHALKVDDLCTQLYTKNYWALSLPPHTHPITFEYLRWPSAHGVGLAARCSLYTFWFSWSMHWAVCTWRRASCHSAASFPSS